jgi:hypothetical protein
VVVVFVFVVGRGLKRKEEARKRKKQPPVVHPFSLSSPTFFRF